MRVVMTTVVTGIVALMTYVVYDGVYNSETRLKQRPKYVADRIYERQRMIMHISDRMDRNKDGYLEMSEVETFCKKTGENFWDIKADGGRTPVYDPGRSMFVKFDNSRLEKIICSYERKEK